MHPLLNFSLPPALILVIGALFIPLFNERLRPVYMLALPVFALVSLYSVPNGMHWELTMMDYRLILGRIDGLSRVFGTIFLIAAILGVVYSMKVKENLQHVAAMVYAGSAVGVTFSADFFSFYIFWEFMAIASTFLILARKTDASRKAAMRYIMVHIFGGLSLLAGIILQINSTGSTEFSLIGLESTAAWFIFVGVAVNAAVMPLHGWLKDAYPEATITGAVFLSAFTTKSAIYVMARMFPGTTLLIWLGAIMVVVPVIYAVLEDDIRRVLAYSLINQLGFMLCGIGIGTELAINGAAAHAFCHILYKALLFMTAGAVLERTGKIRCSELGGLYKTMPLTCVFCIIGAASISAFPFFCGFISKTMIISAAGEKHMVWVWLTLVFASACVIPYIKVPYFMFFGKDSGMRPKEASWNMLVAMGAASFLCIFFAIDYKALYNLLPYDAGYEPYTWAHVVGKLQLLMFGALTFCLMILYKYYPHETRSELIDTDWVYRKGAPLFNRVVSFFANGINDLCDRLLAQGLTSAILRFAQTAPKTVSVILLAPLKPLFGKTGDSSDTYKARVESAFATGSIPVGISAAAATIFILILFLVK